MNVWVTFAGNEQNMNEINMTFVPITLFLAIKKKWRVHMYQYG